MKNIKNKDLQLLSDYLEYTEEIFGLDFLESPSFNSIGKDKNVSQQVSKNTPRIVKIYKNAKKDLFKNADLIEGDQLQLANGYTGHIVPPVPGMLCHLKQM